MLGDYDALAVDAEPGRLDRALGALVRRARTQEDRLSALKRRRDLARMDAAYMPAYRAAAVDAARDFPASEPLAALAVEALICERPGEAGRELDEGEAAALRGAAAALTSPRFGALAVGARLALGVLDDPAAAAADSGLERALDAGGLTGDLVEDLALDGLLLELVRGPSPGTALRLSAWIRDRPGDAGALVMGAEYFYDQGDFPAAAELFARTRTDGGLAREADALALDGQVPAARNIWLALGADGGDPALRARSLYNLAASARDDREAVAWLERLFAGGDGASAAQIYGAIRYTRLLDTLQAVRVLEERRDDSPLLDLELLRRRMEALTVDRAAADLWLLLGRHPGVEDLYRWAAWYFDRQKRYDETAQALKVAALGGPAGSWPVFHRALALLREGRTAEAEALFTDLDDGRDWRVKANLARILEGRRSTARALEAYEAAAALVGGDGADGANAAANAAVLQLRISRCLEALGRVEESRRAVEKAQALDPGSLNARHEIRRMGL